MIIEVTVGFWHICKERSNNAADILLTPIKWPVATNHVLKYAVNSHGGTPSPPLRSNAITELATKLPGVRVIRSSLLLEI